MIQAGVEAPSAVAGTYGSYANYSYDAFGDRLSESTPSYTTTVTANAATNHISTNSQSITYDGAGHVTRSGNFLYQYDASDQVTEIFGIGLAQRWPIYNASDERIIVCGDGETGPCRWTLRGVNNEVLREYESGPITGSAFAPYYLWTEDYVYRGALLAGAQREAAEGGTLHFHLDHLGSPRLITNADGQLIEKNEFAPFGRELIAPSAQPQTGYDTETRRFTAHERDFLSGTSDANAVDYMHARYYSPTYGRFLSADPVIGRAAMFSPQLWNRYSYVGNNPINFFDPTGRVLQIAACRNGPSDSCTNAYNLYVSTFGAQSQDAAKHLQVGKNGIVSITGMTGAAFAKQFGIMGRATMLLTGIRSSVFSIEVGRTGMTDAHGGGACDCYAGPDRRVGVDSSAGTRKLQGAEVGPTETLVHEIGHAVASLYPRFAYQLGLAKWRSNLGAFDGNYESYATAFENVWRHSVLGDPNPRSGYVVGMDQWDTTDVNQLFPPGVFK